MSTPAPIEINFGLNYGLAFGIVALSSALYVYLWDRLVLVRYDAGRSDKEGPIDQFAEEDFWNQAANDSDGDFRREVYAAVLTGAMTTGIFFAFLVATNQFSIFNSFEVLSLWTVFGFSFVLYLCEESGLMILRNSLDEKVPDYRPFTRKIVQTYQRRLRFA